MENQSEAGAGEEARVAFEDWHLVLLEKSPFHLFWVFKKALIYPQEEFEQPIQEKSVRVKWGLVDHTFLETGMRDMAEVIWEPKVFQQTITKPCDTLPFPAASSKWVMSLLPVGDTGQRHPAWSKPREKVAESGIPDWP